jgi:hypothetical protein
MSIDSNRPIIAITTRSSISVKARRARHDTGRESEPQFMLYGRDLLIIGTTPVFQNGKITFSPIIPYTADYYIAG